MGLVTSTTSNNTLRPVLWQRWVAFGVNLLLWILIIALARALL